MQPNYILHALTANAATLGVHWIYDPNFIANLAKTQSIFFIQQTKVNYDQAKPSYLAYPNEPLGGVTVQGRFLMWLYEALKINPNLSQQEYGDLIYSHIRPGGDYHGYIETYGHKFLINRLNASMTLNLPSIVMDDDHLVGFVPYIVVKQLGLPTDKAWELAQLFTDKTDYLDLFKMFDHVFSGLKIKSLKTLLEEAVLLAPRRFQMTVKKALEINDTLTLVKQYAGTACSINQSIPIIVHLLYHSTSFEDMLMRNAFISGAISERGMMLGAILGAIYPPPETMIQKLSHPIKSIFLV
jgi:hypothetical protein